MGIGIVPAAHAAGGLSDTRRMPGYEGGTPDPVQGTAPPCEGRRRGTHDSARRRHRSRRSGSIPTPIRRDRKFPRRRWKTHLSTANSAQSLLRGVCRGPAQRRIAQVRIRRLRHDARGAVTPLRGRAPTKAVTGEIGDPVRAFQRGRVADGRRPRAGRLSATGRAQRLMAAAVRVAPVPIRQP